MAFQQMPSVLNKLDFEGFFARENVLSKFAVEALKVHFDGDSQAGIRNLFAIPEVQSLARSAAVRGLMEMFLGEKCFAVRAILFDKSPEANWNVAWHQDLTIAVKSQKEVPGYGPWSSKAGVVHVQPPVPILERMLTIRIHLDDCGTENGPLKVIPGSHRHGKLSPEQIQRLRSQTTETTCLIPCGGALVMRPLLLHASSKADSPSHRRVIHLEFATIELVSGLEWHDRIGSLPVQD